jgi:HEAT repeat protein
MFRLLAATCLLLPPGPALPPTCRTDATPLHGARATVEEKALKALDAWLKLYRAGKIDFTSKASIAKESIAAKYGVAPKNPLGQPTWAGDLELILEAVARTDDGPAARALLEVAAIGIDEGKYTREMAPAEVRAAGERWAAKLRTPAAKDEFGRAARGELKVDKGRATAFRAAAAKCLGLLEDRTLRSTLEPLLADTEEVVRVNAAEAFARLGDDRSAEPLVALVRRETCDAVLMTAAQSLRTIFARHVPGALQTTEAPAAGQAGVPQPAELRLAVQACIDALGRTNWRADMALVRFLDDFRTPEAVPALIGVLERFRDRPDDVKSGKLSGLLQFQAHELLVAMTGAMFPADQPDAWRRFWEAQGAQLVVTGKREPRSDGGTSADGFCGIPIQGTRVVFVLDLSGSMNWAMRGREQQGGRRQTATGLDFAKQELHRAMATISPQAQFNLITFNGDAKAESWSKDLVAASPKNRERFLKFVDKLEARGGTNLWSALELALRIDSVAYGSRYATDVDEVFVLSDGAPSVGAVIEPVEILRLIKEANRFAATRINTVFVNTEPPADQRMAMPPMEIPPEELMRRLAEQHGGRFQNL